MKLTWSQLFICGVLLYIGTWLSLLLCYLRYCRSAKDFDIYKARRLYDLTRFSRLWGWAAVLFLLILTSSILPKVYVITYDPARRMAEHKRIHHNDASHEVPDSLTLRESLFADRYFVFYSYEGHPCSASMEYVSNETGYELALFSTTLSNHLVTNVSDPELISPHTFVSIGKTIQHFFETPRPLSSYNAYVSQNKGNFKTNVVSTEWTLDLASVAIPYIRELQEEFSIPWRKIPDYIELDETNYHPDSSLLNLPLELEEPGITPKYIDDSDGKN